MQLSGANEKLMAKSAHFQYVCKYVVAPVKNICSCLEQLAELVQDVCSLTDEVRTTPLVDQ
jgi:hypothetical protein